MTQLAKLLMTLFRTRPDTYAEQRKDGSYMRVPFPLSEGDVDAHLKGARTLGVYLIDDPTRDTCSFCAIDIDTRDEELFECIFSAMRTLDISNYAVCEDSGNKGRHIFVFFFEHVKAALARRMLKAVLKQANAPGNIEVFPKQDSIHADGFGSLIKLPLGIHRKSGRRSYFFANDFNSPVDAGKLLRALPEMSTEELASFVKEHTALWAPPPPSGAAAAGKKLKGTPPCISQILRGVEEGARDVALFNLSVYFLRLKRLSPAKTLEELLKWNEKNCPPLSQGMVSWKLGYVTSSDYDHIACRMDEMQEFCSDDCSLKGRK